MKMRPIGSSGIEASAIAFGAWAIGGWMWGGADEGDAVKALHEALDQGINFIDTAPIYGFGVSEEIVGKAHTPLHSRPWQRDPAPAGRSAGAAPAVRCRWPA